MTAEQVFDTFAEGFTPGDKIDKELIIGIMQAYAKSKCEEQRVICANTGKHQKFGLYQYKKDQMINAEEPIID